MFMGPPFILSRVASGIDPDLVMLLSAVLSATGMTFGAMLPFLILSFVNGFYRERLKGLLHLGDVAQPPRIAPPMPAVPELARG